MSKEVIENYVFNAAGKQVTLTDFSSIELSRLALITNVTDNIIIFSFTDPDKGASVSGNVITLDYDTSGMSDSDAIRIDYNTLYDDYSYTRETIGNQRRKFYDMFTGTYDSAYNDTTGNFDLTSDSAQHLVIYGGNTAGSNYLRISLSPFLQDSYVNLDCKKYFEFPSKYTFGITSTFRVTGQQVFYGIAGIDSNNDIIYQTPLADVSITGSTITISSNVATITAANHGLLPGTRVSIVDCPDNRLNAGPVVVTVIDANTITVPITLSNASYTSTGGVIKVVDPLDDIYVGVGNLLENTTVTNGSFVSRDSGAPFRTVNTTITTTAPTQNNTSAYADAWISGNTAELYTTNDEINLRTVTNDATTTANLVKYNQSAPLDDYNYKIKILAGNLPNLPIPGPRITSITKSGSTTATVTTDSAHGLTTSNWIQLYGVADQTNFPNLSTVTQVASIVSSTSFTIVIGTTTTGSSSGGTIWISNGSITAPGIVSMAIQSISRTSNELNVVGSASWSGPLPGDYIHLYGMTGSAQPYEGAYRVLRLNGTTLVLSSVGSDFGSISTGGVLIRRTDVRLHYVKVSDFTSAAVEIYGGRANSADYNNAVQVNAMQGGTWTVQPGNTANTTAWLVNETQASGIVTIYDQYSQIQGNASALRNEIVVS